MVDRTESVDQSRDRGTRLLPVNRHFSSFALTHILLFLGSARPGIAILGRDLFDFQNPTADMQIALWVGNFDSGGSEMLFDQEIKVAFKSTRPVAHYAAPHDQLEMD
jgi:hypothetical protein